MSDSILTALIPPLFDTIYVTIDGTPYRCSAAEAVIYAQSKHVSELEGRGFTAATATTVDIGDTTTFDQGWAVAD